MLSVVNTTESTHPPKQPALNVARFPIFTADQTRCRGRGPGRAAVCRADEKQIEYKSRRMRRELATTPAWVLSQGIEMAKTENRKPATDEPEPAKGAAASQLAS